MNSPYLVITSIAGADHPVLQQYAVEAVQHQTNLIIVGDRKSPADFHLPGCEYFSLNRQQAMPLAIAEKLPFNHYSRKNIGYLAAMKAGAEIIIETDDDNLPYPEFWSARARQVDAHHLVDQGWLNVYRYFCDENIWPRGFSLEHILEPIPVLESTCPVYCPIQQGLATENPDVDAIYRLTRHLPIEFRHGANLALGRGTICPFNSQNTTWFREAFLLMYLPSYCSFRMTDIWRSFVAQRLAWTCDWNILFHSSTVWQERNAHNLMKDFQDEIPGYLHNLHICEALQQLVLPAGRENLAANLIVCYDKLIAMEMVGAAEMAVLKAWIEDVEHLITT
jgi:hypothetical protein